MLDRVRLSLIPAILAAGLLPAAGMAALVPRPRSVETDIRAARVFEEPLVPVRGMTSDTEDADLLSVINRYQASGNAEQVDGFLSFLNGHPSSPWNPSLLLDLGLNYRHGGYYSRALLAWEKSWALTKNLTDPAARAVADRSICELIELNSRLGRRDRLNELYAEIKGRDIQGPSAQRIQNLKQGLWLMDHEPGTSFRCGPMALAACARVLGHPEATSKLNAFESGSEGTSLQENLQWAEKCGLSFVAVFRKPGEQVVIPSLLHWKAGHFAAVVAQQGDRFLLQDPTFGDATWVSRNAIDDEASGYELVPTSSAPAGWPRVGEKEADKIRGMGTIGTGPTNGPFPPKTKPSSCGMPTYSFDLPYVALEFGDIPVGYQPPKGYPVQFELTYTQQDTYQPQTFTYSNVGPGWSFTWLSYIVDDPANPGQNVSLFSTIGGLEPFTGYDSTSGNFQSQAYTHEGLQRLSSGTYQVQSPDGSLAVYSQADGATTYPRKMFLTQRIDPAGNILTFGYDSQLRLSTVTDALGQVTQLVYGDGSDPYKITAVHDPFGRSAVLTYNASGELQGIQDALGLSSTFAYGPTPSSPSAPATFINAMTTPYGTTQFSMGGSGINKWVVATDPLGNRERMELNQGAINGPSNFPTGFVDGYMSQRNVFFWDKRAMASFPGDYTKAQVYHFLHAYPNDPNIAVMSQTLEASKKPLEAWVFRTYAGQSQNLFEGTSSNPSSVERVLDDGTTQANQYTYNALGHVTQETDPLGRVTSYVYAANGVDLLEVHNLSGGNDFLMAKYSYNSQHRPLTVTDASGQMTTFTYNGAGQATSVSNAKGEKTTMIYSPSGYLSEIDGALPGAVTTFTYDGAGRVQSVTGPDGYVVQYAYDNLDRRTKTTYMDGTTDQVIYKLLDVGATKDRLNHWSMMSYNPLRQMIEVQDAAGHVTKFDWCGCGTLESLTDPLNRITTWTHDLEGRVTSKVYPDLTQYHYQYDGVGRLIQRIDAKGQVTNYTYFVDDALAGVSYVNASVSTPSVSYQYDPLFPRISSMVDGTGTTTYQYYPISIPAALGAGRVRSIQSPGTANAITYSYDELGRVATRTIGTAVESRAFDSLGRISQVTNPLGTFQYAYVGATSRLDHVNLPNGQVTKLSYASTAEDSRLTQIANQKNDGTNISTFGYSYDAAGQIQTWAKQMDAQPPQVSALTYDPIGQVLSSVIHDGTVSGQILKTFVYGYDDAGNRTSEQIDGQIATATYNNLNQMTGQRTNTMTAAIAPSGAKPLHGAAKSNKHLAPQSKHQQASH
ncbi:MAG: hypothetical protein JST05_07225 [Acidobacteria bacterium]|nr:hypothetical protein [Acidobacteriota bacterium]